MKELIDSISENRLANILLNDPSKLDGPEVNGGIITDPRLSALISCATKLRVTGRDVSAINMGLESGDPDIEALAAKLQSRSLPSGSYESLVAVLSDLRARRDMARLCKDAHEKCFDMGEDSSGLISSLESRVLDLRRGGTGGVRAGGDMSDVREELRWRAANPMQVRGHRMGFPILEGIIDGFMGGQLYVIGARPSVGKTALITTMILNMMQSGLVPFICSLEMKAMLLKTRIVSSLSGVPLGISKERPFTGAEIKALNDAISKLEGMKWFYEDTSRIDIEEICSHARRMKKENEIDAVFIDYLQIIQNKEFKASDARLRVGSNCFKLKQLSEELDIPVIVPAQLKRKEGYFSTAKKCTVIPEPELHDLKESGDIEQDSDVIMLMSRDQRENSCYTEVRVAKNRNGGVGVVAMEFTPHTTSFKEDALSTSAVGKGTPDE